jgi:glycosyltransferase involved in cell wall biosynthesis
MKIKAFILTFNEADIIAFTVKHYQQFCSEIHIYDNYSTDDTRDICTKMGCIVHMFGQEGVLDDREYLKVKNNCWKEHRDADLVVVCDADEILYDCYGLHPKNDSVFLKHITLVKCKGYNLYSDCPPIDSWEEIKLGYSEPLYDKVLMFNPRHITDINYGYGAHGARPVVNNNNPLISKGDYRLHHMRYVGGVDRMIARYNTYKTRMCEFNKLNGLGFQYLKSDNDIRNEWEEVKQKSILI